MVRAHFYVLPAFDQTEQSLPTIGVPSILLVQACPSSNMYGQEEPGPQLIIHVIFSNCSRVHEQVARLPCRPRRHVESSRCTRPNPLRGFDLQPNLHLQRAWTY